ncbi:MAG TPA: hypothetical protein VHL80_19375 [Polyangia bacterium]|nr:hypothetical protein [Polyangia bacterium]
MWLDRRRPGAATVAVFAALGCSSSPSVPRFHPTTAPGDTPLSQLTPDEIHMVCEEEARYDVDVSSSPRGIEATCLAVGWSEASGFAGQEQHLGPGVEPSTAALQKACADLEAGCLRNPPAPFFVDPCAQASAIVLDGCAGTLAQYAACQSDLEARRVTRTPPCSRIAAPAEPAPAPTDAGPPAPEPQPASCVAFWASCPPLADKTLESPP